MNIDNQSWDDGQDAKLKGLWAEGIAAGEIGLRMGRSESSVANRANRLGLSRRRDPVKGWTEARVEQVRRLWIEGRSATQIAMELNCGMSRNAVIGKIHRLGMSQHGRAACAAPAPDVRKRQFVIPKVARSHVRPPKPGRQNRPALIHGDYAPSSEAMRLARAAEGQAANDRVAKGAAVESPKARPWMETRKMDECNWPIGERGHIKSCCNPVQARGWCAGHLAIGLAPTQPQALRPRDASRRTRFDRLERDVPGKPHVERSIWDEGRAA